MKAEDLMIGNWVLTLDSTHKEKVFAQVDAIEEGKHSILVTREYSNWFVDIEWIEPVPLTQEILEKNGLEKDNHGRLYGEYFDEDINQDLEITVDSKTEEVWWSYNWNEYYIIRLRYVHQLQNALHICGIEKKIVI